ncbi:MAG TPA: phospholipid carrier-dependent glycosyltransferase [Gammaproteobacteria bacterium]|nr:phospholipid carrier-dependent glycosyltransferase [Gammaproteobacteria bacterium]
MNKLNNARRSGFGLLIVVLLASHFLISGLLPLSDPSEGRYSDIAKTMVDTSNYTTPMLWLRGQHIPYMGKPPLGFWAMAAAIELFGDNAFATRLPSGVAGLLLLLLMFWILKRYLGREQALSSVLITASSLAYFVFSGAALVDMVLTLFASGALFAYFAFLREKTEPGKQRFSLLVFVLLALGFLVKGPVVLVYFGLPAFLWTLINKQWAGLRQHPWFAGISIFLLVSAPWFVLAEQATPGFLRYFFVNENFLRFVSHQYGDLYGAGRTLPYGSALVLIVLSTVPWSALLCYKWLSYKGGQVTDIRSSSHQSRHLVKRFMQYLGGASRAKNGTGLFFLGLLSLTLFWSLARQLLVYYLLPLIPLFAVWCAGELQRLQLSISSIAKTAVLSILVFSILIFASGQVLVHKRSTQAVIAYAKTLLQPSSTQRLYFVRKTPNTAYFYGNGLILSHADESPVAGVNKALRWHNPPILIALKKYYKQIPASLLEKFRLRQRIGEWRIFTRNGPPENNKPTVEKLSFTYTPAIVAKRPTAVPIQPHRTSS